MRLIWNPVPTGHEPPGKETWAEFSVLAAPVDCSWIRVTGALSRKPDYYQQRSMECNGLRTRPSSNDRVARAQTLLTWLSRTT
jgi:hypothetical protein